MSWIAGVMSAPLSGFWNFVGFLVVINAIGWLWAVFVLGAVAIVRSFRQ